MTTAKQKILVTCPKAIPHLLRAEIEALGYPAREAGPAAVETEGGFDDCIKLNLWLRTGHRVLWLIREFQAADADALYRELTGLEWEKYIRADGYFSILSSVENPTIRDQRFASLRCKDAIVDRIRNQCGRRPDAGPLQDQVVVFLYWKGTQASVYFDTSGEPLSRRGYRKISLKAPMQETLAAAVVFSTGWHGDDHFLNPMCGSGTLAIEAALMASGRAPGLTRPNFGFMHLKNFIESDWIKIRDDARTAVRKSVSGKILATDIRKEAVEAAMSNAANAGVKELIEFEPCDFRDSPVPRGTGVVVLNPEYGERLGESKELEKTYRAIGEYFETQCRGYRGFIFTGNQSLGRKVGLRPVRKTTFFNSNIECQLLEYQL